MQTNLETDGNISRGLHGSCMPQPGCRVRYFFQSHRSRARATYDRGGCLSLVCTRYSLLNDEIFEHSTLDRQNHALF